MKLIFLDIDGVLNGHKFCKAAQSTGIDPTRVRELNRIVRRTGAAVVLSSAWRYMVHGKAMTLDGFGYMLRTHGVAGVKLVGLTIPDEVCPACKHDHRRRGGGPSRVKVSDTGEYSCRRCGTTHSRGGQITRWVLDNLPVGGVSKTPYVVIDDLDLGIRHAGHPFVQTNGKLGLTRAKADEVIRLLAPAPARGEARA